MRIYVEATEILEESNAGEGDFIRLDATEAGVEQTLQDLKSILNPNKRYSINIHYCLHDSEGACTVVSEEEYLRAKNLKEA